MMDRDTRTRTGARAPGAERQSPLEWWSLTGLVASTLSEENHAAAGDANGGRKLRGAMAMHRREGLVGNASLGAVLGKTRRTES